MSVCEGSPSIVLQNVRTHRQWRMVADSAGENCGIIRIMGIKRSFEWGALKSVARGAFREPEGGWWSVNADILLVVNLGAYTPIQCNGASLSWMALMPCCKYTFYSCQFCFIICYEYCVLSDGADCSLCGSRVLLDMTGGGLKLSQRLIDLKLSLFEKT